MKTVVLYNIISFIILVALIFVLRIVSKSNLRQNQQLVIKVIATILIVCVIAFVLFIDAIAFGIRTSSRLTIPVWQGSALHEKAYIKDSRFNNADYSYCIYSVCIEPSRNEFSLEQYHYLVTVWFIYSCDSHVAYWA